VEDMIKENVETVIRETLNSKEVKEARRKLVREVTDHRVSEIVSFIGSEQTITQQAKRIEELKKEVKGTAQKIAEKMTRKMPEAIQKMVREKIDEEEEYITRVSEETARKVAEEELEKKFPFLKERKK